MSDPNRTIYDTGVRLSGKLLDLPAPVGTGVTPVQAAEVAQPLIDFLNMIPYTLDENGVIDYRTSTNALTHMPVLTYAPGHPKAGQLIEADHFGGAYITRYGGAPMPFIDMDMIPPYALQKVLVALHEVLAAQLSAT